MVRSALHQAEKKLCARVHARLSVEVVARTDSRRRKPSQRATWGLTRSGHFG